MKNKVLIITLLVVASLSLLLLQKRPSQTETQSPTTAEPTEEKVNKGRYIPYSQENYEKNEDKRRVLFFYASWCPTCKVLNQKLSQNDSAIPEDVVVLKTDYDRELDLKRKYNVTYQHTFVQVDEEGSEVTKWNGGGVEELKQEIK